jgi:hypothetical protein
LTAKILVKDATPLDILKMTVLAAADETDRRCLSTLPIVGFVFKALRRLQILEASESAAVWQVTSDGIADKPAWKNRRLYAWRYAPGIPRIDRWRPQFRRPIGDKSSVIFKALMEEPGKAGFLDDMERAGSEHLPVIEPLNEHGPFRKVEHCTGTEHPHHLAHSNLVVCHRLLLV